MERYVAERTATRDRVSGLEPHRAYSPGPEPLTYAGRRVVDGQTLALLRADREVLVMDVHPDQVGRLGRFKAGQAVSVEAGRIRVARGGATVASADGAAGDEAARGSLATSRNPKPVR